jgi:hypothetical protein
MTCSVDLGISGAIPYVSKNLKCKRSDAYARIKVAVALPGFPLTAKAFEDGRLSFSRVRAITRLKSGKKEDEWLEFARDHTTEEPCEAIEDAVSNDRESPRPKGSGLLDRRVDLEAFRNSGSRPSFKKR